MSSKAVQGAVSGERDVLVELAETRGRLDAALAESANELNRMRHRCQILENTMRTIGTGEGAFRGRAQACELISRLTPREMAVLKSIAEGHSTKQIAFCLKMTFKTAVSHRTRLMKKLGMHETASLVRVALAAGLVSLHPGSWSSWVREDLAEAPVASSAGERIQPIAQTHDEAVSGANPR